MCAFRLCAESCDSWLLPLFTRRFPAVLWGWARLPTAGDWKLPRCLTSASGPGVHRSSHLHTDVLINTHRHIDTHHTHGSLFLRRIDDYLPARQMLRASCLKDPPTAHTSSFNLFLSSALKRTAQFIFSVSHSSCRVPPIVLWDATITHA